MSIGEKPVSMDFRRPNIFMSFLRLSVGQMTIHMCLCPYPLASARSSERCSSRRSPGDRFPGLAPSAWPAVTHRDFTRARPWLNPWCVLRCQFDIARQRERGGFRDFHPAELLEPLRPECLSIEPRSHVAADHSEVELPLRLG